MIGNRIYEQVFGETWDATRFSDQGYWDFHMAWWMVRDATHCDTRLAAEEAIEEALS